MGQGGAGSLVIDVIRPAPGVALIHTATPSHDEYFFVATGEHTLTITVRDTGAKSLPEPRVHVLHKPYDWNMTPSSDPPSADDDHDLLMKVWQLIGSG